MISVLLSAFNESANPFFWKTLSTVEELKSHGLKIEVIVGITPGSDDTQSMLNDRKVTVAEIKTTMRGQRYNQAFQKVNCSQEDWVVLNHPRSFLQPEAFSSLKNLPQWNKWGGFTHKFDHSHPVLDFTSWWSNNVRGDLKKIYYLDHCLFVRKKAFEQVGGFPSVEIFEDTLLTERLGRLGAPLRLAGKSTTSSQRFTTNGIFKQALNNQIYKCKYHLGFDNGKINESYEKGLNLNR